LYSEGKWISILGAEFGDFTAANLMKKNLSSLSPSVEYQICIIEGL
jgi:hypothetical protein